MRTRPSDFVGAPASGPEVVRLVPAFFPSLALDVTLAPGWVRTHDRHQLACVLGLPVPVGVFAPAERDAALAAVSVSALPFEVGIADWCRFRFVQAHWTLSSARFIDTPHGRRFEVIGSRDTELGPRRRRDVSFLHGRWLVQIHLVSDAASWSPTNAAWSIIGELAAVAGEPTSGGCERRRTVIVPSTPICFDIPVTWTIAAAHRGAVDVELVADRAQQAWIHIRARHREHASTSLLGRADMLARELVRHGFALRHVSHVDSPGNDARLDDLGFQRGCVVDAISRGGGPHDARMWHRALAEFDIDAMLVAPPPGARHLPWMRAIRAFEIAFGTCRVSGA